MGTADNLSEALDAATARLAAKSDSARLDAELLLARVLGRMRSYLYAHPEQPLDGAASAQYQAWITRRAAGEPIAHLLGEREFWSLRLTVGPEVLIPRPETELVVERALALLGDGADRPAARVADLGCGCGAIALALAADRAHWRLLATDRSAAALRIARLNAQRLGLDGRIEWLEGDWFEPLAERRFDAIVSNPPYLTDSEALEAALRFEPRMALGAGPDGLTALRHLIAGAPAHLEPGGWLVLEHAAHQAAPLAAALVARGYARVRCHRDLAGRDRVTEARWSP
jgi:release factor glutamine methyltransferase